MKHVSVLWLEHNLSINAFPHLFPSFHDVQTCFPCFLWSLPHKNLEFPVSEGQEIVGQAIERMVNGRLGVLSRGIVLTGENEEAERDRIVLRKGQWI